MARSLVRHFLGLFIVSNNNIHNVSLVMASVIQRFDLAFVNPSYNLEIKQTLTVKPNDLLIQATLRAGAVNLQATPSSALMASRSDAPSQTSQSSVDAGIGMPLYVLYGSNTGTSEAFAQRIANEASSYGGFHTQYVKKSI
jgi:cytochrome P450/NADPH-cytochrome P450 reductase